MERILQIGEGNFLRAFAEYYIQLYKECSDGSISVAVCQPRTNTRVIDALNAQNCKYHICLKGRLNSKVVDDVKEIDCVSRCIDTSSQYDILLELFKSDDLEIIISNTTEAGITYNSNDKIETFKQNTFPAKVTALLYERFKAGKKGLIFLPVELIENNGDRLKETVLLYSKLWNLEKSFSKYVENECEFCNTLVDRIVTGHIDFESDNCAVACEPYGSWLIQGEKVKNSLPLDKITGDIKFVDSLTDYRNRKVRILNGAHTMSVLAGYLSGFDIVRDMVNDSLFSEYISKGLDEVKSTLTFEKSEIDAYANSVLERFANPFIDHKLLDISLNSISKFTARCLPSIKDFADKQGKAPKILSFSLAALIAFYTHKGADRSYQPNDDEKYLAFFNSIKNSSEEEIVSKALKNTELWGEDLTLISDFETQVAQGLKSIVNNGILNAVKEVVNEQTV